MTGNDTVMSSQIHCTYYLKIFLDDYSEELKDKYKDAIIRHNTMTETSNHPDSGFDLYTPLSEIEKLNEGIRVIHDDGIFGESSSHLCDSHPIENNEPVRHHQNHPMTYKGSMKVKTAMYKISDDGQGGTRMTPVGFYLYPRSSISKTCVRLANNVGIIDSGYRGCLAGMFDIVSRVTSGMRPGEFQRLEPYHRLLQICSPTLEPFTTEMVFAESDLGITNRGSGGFGSTGSN
jgi:hypothetical protein